MKGDPQRVVDRRVIEALRAGIPSRDAVLALGCPQPDIERKFKEQLEAAIDIDQPQAPGLMVTGNFGSGKSHLLQHLQEIALAEKFICSKIVISKETPLHDPEKFYQAAIQGAVVPDRRGLMLNEIAATLNYDSPSYGEFFRWLNQDHTGLNPRFAATVFLHERASRDQELADRIVQEWSGDSMGLTELRRYLKQFGEAATYRITGQRKADLALQRLKFVSRLIIAAGYAGWVLLIDETELIGRYSWKQRARSYAAMARYAGRLKEDSFPGLLTVYAITSDFAAEVLDGRNDFEMIPGRLTVSVNDADSRLSRAAERGMRMIAKEALPLHSPDADTLTAICEQVRSIHSRAYDWQAPPMQSIERLTSTRMREYVRRWINEWDLQRLDPHYQPSTAVSELKLSLEEEPDLLRADDEAAAGLEAAPDGGAAADSDPPQRWW